MNLNIVILAAGQGTRMKSSLPKVLHPIGGKPMVAHVISSAKILKATKSKIIMVYGHGGDLLRDTINDTSLHWVQQAEQLGTGHAVQQAADQFEDDAVVLVLYGDVPLITPQTLTFLFEAAKDDSLAILTMFVDQPSGYGRIIRNSDSQVLAITEEKDAGEAEKLIKEVNTGFLAVKAQLLCGWLAQLKNNNSQGEYYLTDIISLAVQDKVTIHSVQAETSDEVLGVNSKTQLAYLERCYQQRQCEVLMQQGVTLIDPARVDIRGSLTVGKDVSIDANVLFEGDVILGDNVSIAANCVIKNSTIASGVDILPMCHIEDSKLGANCRVGPYSRLRPGSALKGDNHIGNFVEIKNSIIESGSKVNHLTYIGDTDMGSGVNIGAGTITANYDGANKHRTKIGDNASTGSNSVLVAPIEVGAGATIGAGTVLTKNAPEGELTLARSVQKSVSGWARPVKKK
ncbi:N-acetylglucosamine-1-phosphate uridyltransferase / Glucosamine-1-phosphate N-acetyltransferase [hydrothermal vent metagenome]|uniref:N-acetylglucosamine-1-phosphate uridyltransferase / Glucosamine-1-phosphate N-acetyltransferase n=1 Tax=hydrothermal vent metagenome TaxID=652676 RepID=A0A3B1A8X0_9ZZZZ